MPYKGGEQSSYLLEDYKDRIRATSVTSSSSSSTLPISPVSLTEDKQYGHTVKAYSEDKDLSNLSLESPTIRRPWWRWRCSYREGCDIITTATSSLLLGLLPSFLLSSNGTPEGELHATAYLDGLRGVAAFFVFIHHFILDWYPELSAGYASSGADHWLAQLPLVRVIFSGRGMVTLFFVISGYVLSYKTLRQVRRREFAPVLETLTSSVFRRGIRLFLPVAVSTFISLLIIRLDWYQYDPKYANLLPYRMPTFWDQFQDWRRALFETTNPFRTIDAHQNYTNQYDGHLWTIPIEFRGSIVVFLTLLFVAKAKQGIRLFLMTYLTLYTLYVTHWDLYLFLFGMLLCEIDWIRTDRSPAPSLTSGPVPQSRHAILRLLSRYQNLLNHLWTIPLFILSLHLLCYPDVNAASTPGYIYLASQLTPLQYEPFTDIALTQRFWLSIGASLMGLSLAFSPPLNLRKPKTSRPPLAPTSLLQYPFTTRPAQYLGRISFALYMMHGLVLYTIGMQILWKALKPGEEDKFHQWFLVAVVVNTTLVLWIADVFWRAVDANCVRLGMRVRGWCWVRG